MESLQLNISHEMKVYLSVKMNDQFHGHTGIITIWENWAQIPLIISKRQEK